MAKRTILIAEDNEADRLLIEDALGGPNEGNDLRFVQDGAEALAFLRKAGEHRDAPRPDLLLLDFNLPKMHGVDVLRTLQEDEALRTIPVVVLTTSDSRQDMTAAYEAKASAYFVKPVDVREFFSILSAIDTYWRLASLPSP